MTEKQFGPLPFDSMNEADVRAEVVDRLLNILNYRRWTENNVVRGRPLTYPKVFLGRKKPRKDPDIVGIPDYLCEVIGASRWVFEAKSPVSDISQDDIDQTYTYAAHPEIQAVFYSICNGRRLLVFQKDVGPHGDPLLDIPYEDLEDKLDVIGGLLGPEAIRRKFKLAPIDIGKPLAPGYPSTMRITGGHIQYDEVRVSPIEFEDTFRPLVGFNVAIQGDSCRRNDTGGIEAVLRANPINEAMHAFSRMVGLETFTMTATQPEISTDREHPTIFDGSWSGVLPRGTDIYNMLTWRSEQTQVALSITTSTKAVGFLKDDRFSGVYYAVVAVIPSLAPPLSMVFDLRLVGKFEITISE